LTDWLGIEKIAHTLQWFKEGLDLDLKEETSSSNSDWLSEKEGAKEATAVWRLSNAVQSKGSQRQSEVQTKDQAYHGSHQL